MIGLKGLTMRYLHCKIIARRGDVVQVKHSQPTRVLILEERDFKRYKNNQSFNYFGGHQEEAPFEFILPRSTNWHVVVEKGSYYAPIDLKAEISVIRLPTISKDLQEENFEVSSAD